jgi:hypothetical protein
MEKALHYFRCLVALLYREAGVITQCVHPVLGRQAKLAGSFFKDRKGQARLIYRQVRKEKSPSAILGPFEERTGQSLDDLCIAFSEGEWPRAFGGPNWAAIANATRQLKDALERDDLEGMTRLVKQIDQMEHNTGRIVDKFRQLY